MKRKRQQEKAPPRISVEHVFKGPGAIIRVSATADDWHKLRHYYPPWVLNQSGVWKELWDLFNSGYWKSHPERSAKRRCHAKLLKALAALVYTGLTKKMPREREGEKPEEVALDYIEVVFGDLVKYWGLKEAFSSDDNFRKTYIQDGLRIARNDPETLRWAIETLSVLMHPRQLRNPEIQRSVEYQYLKRLLRE